MKRLLYLLAILIFAGDVYIGYQIYEYVNRPTITEIMSEHQDLFVRDKKLDADWFNHSVLEEVTKILDNDLDEAVQELEKYEIDIEISNVDDPSCEVDTAVNSYVSITGYELPKDYKISFVGEEDAQEVKLELHKEANFDSLIEQMKPILDSKIKEMKRARGQMQGGRLVAIFNGEEGKTYSEDDLISKVNDIKEKLLDNPFQDVTLELAFETIPISVTAADIEAVDTKVSSFTTSFAPGGSRGTNVKVAASRLNGMLICPGETLSVDQTILSRNAANGYQKAGSYQNGRTVQTYGGGVCQVSTTLYGAIIRAGIIPTERNAHSMAVAYVPLGLDAAIAEGYKDLKITNTYDSPIYIESIVNGGRLTFNIYGKSDLLDGYTYQPHSSSSANGLWATSWLNKMKDGQVVEKIDLFDSSYRPHG